MYGRETTEFDGREMSFSDNRTRCARAVGASALSWCVVWKA